jgi:hypothetical protein
MVCCRSARFSLVWLRIADKSPAHIHEGLFHCSDLISDPSQTIRKRGLNIQGYLWQRVLLLFSRYCKCATFMQPIANLTKQYPNSFRHGLKHFP